MKLCIFSDIHGNQDAMRAAMPCIIGEQADFHIFLGDICGYFLGAVEVWEHLITLPHFIAILGNHDRLFLRFLEEERVSESYTSRYGPSLQNLFFQRKNANVKKFIDWLLSLKEFYIDAEIGFSCYHASPLQSENLAEYIYPDSPLPVGSFSPFVFLGHTHYPMFRKQNESLFCNPGSLGQPRGGNAASYATLIPEKCEWNLHTIPYTPAKFMVASTQCGPYTPCCFE